MSAFSQATFNAAKYSASRPQYAALYDHILSLCSSGSVSRAAQPQPQGDTSSMTLLDLGAGPGLSTFPLVPHFGRTIALDPSPNMINTARELARERGLASKMECMQGSAEKLDMLEPHSVDVAIAAQAAHWFDAPKVYKALEGVLKPKGMCAFWGYGELFFPRHPESTKLVTHFSSKTVGPYWQQPGRGIVEDLLRPVALPEGPAWDKSSFRRTFFDVRDGSSGLAQPAETGKQGEQIEHKPVILKHDWTLEQLAAYLSTWSSVHLYDAEHGGDIATDFVKELSVSLEKEGMKDKVECNWDLCVMSARLK